MKCFFWLLPLFGLVGCNAFKGGETLEDVASIDTPVGEDLAAVLSVVITGSEGGYTFNVEVKSPDTGCDQYADWWEVIGADETLKYRRILAHSHVNEQPFKRSGGPVAIKSDEVVFVRAHMNNAGFGIEVMKGSVNGGFEAATLEPDFAKELAIQDPLPKDCAF